MVGMGRIERVAKGLLVAIALTLTGCGTPEDPPADVPIAIYGRNATASDVWFAVHPATDPLQSVGFGPDIGVACWVAPAGSQIVMLDHAPGRGPTNVVAVVGTVLQARDSSRRQHWVDVARDGSLSSGEGIPPWWTGDPGC